MKLPSYLHRLPGLVVLWLLVSTAYGQVYTDYLPPTPTVAALGKYVDMPVNLASGTPEINIPLYEIKCGSLAVPISLNYHAGGFRVEEEASWVGLGWSLLGGGAITRTIMHKEDTPSRDAFFNMYDGNNLIPNDLYNYPLPNSMEKYGYNYFKYLSGNLSGSNIPIDGYPDLYSFNFNGKSGRYVRINGNIYLMPKQPLDFNSTKIKDDQGNIYEFLKEETASTKGQGSTASSSDVVTSWLLTKIISPDQDTIVFEYVETEFNQPVNISESKRYEVNTAGGLYPPSINTDKFITKVKGWELAKIIFNGGEVKFLSDNIREDITTFLGAKGARKLIGIEIKNKAGTLLKKYRLDHAYFESNPGTQLKEEKRLKLTGLEEELSGGAYGFIYDETNRLPGKTSKAQDHWGYYNGQSNNMSLVPELLDSPSLNSPYAKAERGSNALAVKANLLTKIFYPTGGTTEFLYEGHDYSFINQTQIPVEIKKINVVGHVESITGLYSTNGYDITTPSFHVSKTQQVRGDFNIYTDDAGKGNSYVALYPVSGPNSNPSFIEKFDSNTPAKTFTLTAGYYYLKAHVGNGASRAQGYLYHDSFDELPVYRQPAGGVRIKQIVQHSGNSPDIVKSYEYNMNGNPNFSSGVLLKAPDYTEDDTYYFVDPETDGPAPNPCMQYKHTYKNQVSNSTVVLGAGGHISYREVREYSGLTKDQGKSISRFTSAFEYPNINTSGEYDQTWNRGRLIQKMEFNQSGKLVHKIKNEYPTGSAGYVPFYAFSCASLGGYKCAPIYVTSSNVDELYHYTHYFSRKGATIISEFPFLKTTTEQQYTDNDSVEITTQYLYDNAAHLQPTRVVTTTSNSNVVNVAATTYPDDYADNAATSFITGLKSAHIIVPIEQVVYQQDSLGANQKILKGSLTKYLPGAATGNGLKSEVLQLETSAPVALSGFKFSNKATGLPHMPAFTTFSPDARYKQALAINSYDGQNRPSQLTKTNDRPAALIWCKSGEHLLAEAGNAAVNQVFYNGFEDECSTNAAPAGNAKTGKRAQAGGYIIPMNAVTAGGGYVLSYWGYTAANGWKYQEYPNVIVTAGQTTALPGAGAFTLIDEVRLFPAGALLTTYTYDALVGQTSVCSSNNQVSYYHYDAAGRLDYIKDDQGNILQKFAYKYANQ